MSLPRPDPSSAPRLLPRLRSDLERLEFGAESAYYDKEQKAVHALNATAARIAACCDGCTPVQQLAEALVREYPGLDSPRAREDIEFTVRELAGRQLLEPACILPLVEDESGLQQVVFFEICES